MSANLFFSAFLLFYLLPSGLVLFRRHPRALSVVALNIFGGWTIVGWWLALWWALVPPAEPGSDETVTGARL